jgi:hypothetical protein
MKLVYLYNRFFGEENIELLLFGAFDYQLPMLKGRYSRVTRYLDN